MSAWLQLRASRETARSVLRSIGRSVLGREILLLTIAEPGSAEGKDRVLVTSGFHPAEPDWLATTALVDALLSDDAWAKEMLQNYVIDLVPQINPDGYDLGTNGSNARGINMYWDFRREDPQASPEAVALWNWITLQPPALYIDFHAYVYQLHKDYRPYIRPQSDYPATARPAVRAIDRALISLCHGRAARGRATSDPRSLASQLTAHYGAITYPKFHLHLIHGVEACRRLGVAVARTILDNALPYRPLRARTGGKPWRQSRADRIAGWWAQGTWPCRARQGAQRVVGFVTGSSVPEAVPTASGGLAAHWLAHLWSERATVAPVIVIGDQ
jgi:hypothetical protein